MTHLGKMKSTCLYIRDIDKDLTLLDFDSDEYYEKINIRSYYIDRLIAELLSSTDEDIDRLISLTKIVSHSILIEILKHRLPSRYTMERLLLKRLKNNDLLYLLDYNTKIFKYFPLKMKTYNICKKVYELDSSLLDSIPKSFIKIIYSGLETVEYKKSIDECNEDDEYNNTCYICYVPKDQLKLSCGHTLCKNCINNIIQTHSTNNNSLSNTSLSNTSLSNIEIITCPFCRTYNYLMIDYEFKQLIK